MISDKNLNIWGGILLISILFFPDIEISGSLPAVQFIDLTLPITVSLIIFNKTRVKINNYYLIPLLFCLYIPISMSVNERLGITRDYFEIYKLIKFMVLTLYFSTLDYKVFPKHWFKGLFIALVAVNMLHFFNVFGFHDLLVKVVGGEQLEYFGLNSLGEPATKRMTGMAGNPNINAVIFTFFTIYFLPLKYEPKKLTWFLVAILMVFMCQSRTAIIGISAAFILIFALRLSNWSLKHWFIPAAVVFIYFLAWAITTSFFQYTSYSNNLVSLTRHGGSTMSRLETWSFLFEMIKEKPLLGHGVNKDFFYDNNLYSENEYILMTWRYGIGGLIIYLVLYFAPLIAFFKQRSVSITKRHAFLFVGILIVTALTNNPFQDRTLMVLFAVTLGLFWPFNSKKENSSRL